MTVQGSPLQQVLLSARCCNHSGSFLAQAYGCTVFYNTTSHSFDSYEQLWQDHFAVAGNTCASIKVYLVWLIYIVCKCVVCWESTLE